MPDYDNFLSCHCVNWKPNVSRGVSTQGCVWEQAAWHLTNFPSWQNSFCLLLLPSPSSTCWPEGDAYLASKHVQWHLPIIVFGGNWEKLYFVHFQWYYAFMHFRHIYDVIMNEWHDHMIRQWVVRNSQCW